jgi:hypothetical protein
MAEALRTVHTCRRGILQGSWWPVSPKLVFDQTAAPVPEIIAPLIMCAMSTARKGQIKHKIKKGQEIKAPLTV